MVSNWKDFNMTELQLYHILKLRLGAIITANNNIFNNCPYIKKIILKLYIMVQKFKNKLASLILTWAIDHKFRVDKDDPIHKKAKLYKIGDDKFVGRSEYEAIVFSVLEGGCRQPKFIEDVRFYR
jgi:hypothetical protein